MEKKFWIAWTCLSSVVAVGVTTVAILAAVYDLGLPGLVLAPLIVMAWIGNYATNSPRALRLQLRTESHLT